MFTLHLRLKIDHTHLVDFRQRQPPPQVRIADMGVIIIEIVESSITAVCFRIGFRKGKSRLWEGTHGHYHGSGSYNKRVWL